MISQQLQGYGSWSLTLANPSQSRLRALRMWSTVYIIPAAVAGVEQYTQSEVEAMATYAGVLLDKNSTNNGTSLAISGHDLSWWLGEPFREGILCPTDRTFAAAAPCDVLTELWDNTIPIQLGTCTNPPSTVPNHLFTGTIPAGATLVEALNRVATETYTTWKVNPNGTIDFGTADDIFNTKYPFVFTADPAYRTIIRGVRPESLQTYTNGRALNGARLETPEGTCDAAIANIFDGYKDYSYVRGAVISTAAGDETEATALLQRLVNNRGRLQIGANATFSFDPFIVNKVDTGDTVLVHDDAIDWASNADTDLISLGASVHAQALVCASKSWAFTEGMTACIVAPDSTSPRDITQWVSIEPQSTQFSLGDTANTFLHGVFGSADVVAPVEDIFEG